MIIHHGSDLHLEFGRGQMKVPGGADLLILNGDIVVAQHIQADLETAKYSSMHNLSKRYTKFFRECNEKYPLIFWIMGNHEYYHSRFQDTVPFLRSWLQKSGFTNVTILEKESVVLEGVKFIGCTLWTSLHNFDPIVERAAALYMNDYQVISFNDKNTDNLLPFRVLTTKDTYREHISSVDFITRELKEGLPSFVITHHAPSTLSLKDGRVSSLEDLAYASNLEELMFDYPNLSNWIHGHTHRKVDYLFEQVNVASNPRGYLGHEVGRNSMEYSFRELKLEI